MNVIVCVKFVPDTGAALTLSPDGRVDLSGCRLVANPLDEHAVEAAVRLTEELGGEAVLVTLGTREILGPVRETLAMGPHRALALITPDPEPGPMAVARTLAAAIRKDGMPDIVFTGREASDTQGGQVPYRLGALLCMPVVSEVSALRCDGRAVEAGGETGPGEREILRLGLPCVIGVTKGLNTVRYHRLPDIIRAKAKPVTELDARELGMGGASGNTTRISMEALPDTRRAHQVRGTPAGQAAELIRVLRYEERILPGE